MKNYHLPLTFVFGLLLTACGAAHKPMPENKTEMTEQQTSLTIEETGNGATTIKRVAKEERTEAVTHTGNGDFFLCYELWRTNGTTYIDGVIAHFIPVPNNRYRMEDKPTFKSYSYIDNETRLEVFYDSYPSEEEQRWTDRGYADTSIVYTKLLSYYLSHKADIPVEKDRPLVLRW